MADSANTARRLPIAMKAAVPTLAVVVLLPVAVDATNGTSVLDWLLATPTDGSPPIVSFGALRWITWDGLP
ncbi:MAG: hypothetical protein OXS35_07365 [Dehalococcoidia bacterium]|nr:hypothetical protein [Dehalococcoidia bacterium]